MRTHCRKPKESFDSIILLHRARPDLLKLYNHYITLHHMHIHILVHYVQILTGYRSSILHHQNKELRSFTLKKYNLSKNPTKCKGFFQKGYILKPFISNNLPLHPLPLDHQLLLLGKQY